MEPFSIPVGRVGFEAAKSQDRKESILGEPTLVFLAPEGGEDDFNFFSRERLGQGDEKIGCSEISIVFDNFVFQDQVVSEGVPSQL